MIEICQSEHDGVTGQTIIAAILNYFEFAQLDLSSRMMEEILGLSVTTTESKKMKGRPFDDRGKMASAFAQVSEVLAGAAMQRTPEWDRNE